MEDARTNAYRTFRRALLEGMVRMPRGLIGFAENMGGSDRADALAWACTIGLFRQPAEKGKPPRRTT